MSNDDTETFDYYKNSIRYTIWSGFSDEADIAQIIDEMVDDDEDLAPFASQLRAYADREIAAKKTAETQWPPATDCTRLNDAFNALDAQGILALHNAGYTMSDGHCDAKDTLADDGGDRYSGYIFYHGQDVERVIDGHDLYIAFDSATPDADAKLRVGRQTVEQLRAHGFDVVWDEDPENRILIAQINWQWPTPWQTPVMPAQSSGGFLRRLFGR